jgi:hypothetical protein
VKRTRHKALTTQLHSERGFDWARVARDYFRTASRRLENGFVGRPSACEFVRSKSLSDRAYSRFSDCGYAADNPKAVLFAAVLSTQSPATAVPARLPRSIGMGFTNPAAVLAEGAFHGMTRRGEAASGYAREIFATNRFHLQFGHA